jgi:branched-chain amino acid transport system substrate-binding protein
MKRNTIHHFSAGCILGVAAMLSSLSAFAQSAYKIGLISPLSGANARYGAFANKGANLALKEINASGGVLGRKLELVPGDSQCVPAEGVSATKRMISFDKLPVIIGDVCSSVTLAMQPLAEEAGVLLLNAASSNPAITYKAGVGGFKWTYRNYPTDEVRAAIVLEHTVKNRGLKKLAILSVDSDYGRGAINFTKKYLPRYPDAKVLSEDYYKDAETDFRPVLSKIKNSGAQAIVMYGLVDTTAIIARQMLEMGLAGKVALVGNGEFNSKTTVAVAPSVFNGAVEAAAWVPEWNSPKNQQFVEGYKKAYGGEMPNNHAYTHWETTHLLATAIQQAGSFKNEDIRSALSKIQYDSAMGAVSFDDHNQAILPMVLLEVQDAKTVIKSTITTKVDYPK